jgi:transcriptional regulator with XRE-family HTH domain
MKLRVSSSLNAPAFGWQVRSEVVERERILRGWTRAQLTQEADIDPKTLRDLLAGRRRPTLGTVSTLSRALGMPLRDVIAVIEQPRRPDEPPTGRLAPRPAQAVLPLQ